MPTTAHGYPYPAPTDTPDVPRDIKALADAVEDKANRAGEPLVIRGAGGQVWEITVDSAGTFTVSRDGLRMFAIGVGGNANLRGTLAQNTP